MKENKQLESQKELMLIKDLKRNISESLIRVYLPPAFAEFWNMIECLGYYDTPDYDKMIKILEKGRE